MAPKIRKSLTSLVKPLLLRGFLLNLRRNYKRYFFHRNLTNLTDSQQAVTNLTERFDPDTNKDMQIYEFRQIP